MTRRRAPRYDSPFYEETGHNHCKRRVAPWAADRVPAACRRRNDIRILAGNLGEGGNVR